MDAALTELVWRGIEEANPWWKVGSVPRERTRPFRRHAFPTIHAALKSSERGRGVVVLGPRRIGKTVLLHQAVEQLLVDGIPPLEICFFSLDDVALRDRDLGDLLDLMETRRPIARDRVRYLLLDEVQHSQTWAGWLKRIADRKEPYVFLATGSSATALRRGGQDAGVGRWREMTLFPWSFREHVQIRKLPGWAFSFFDRAGDSSKAGSLEDVRQAFKRLGPPPPDEAAHLDAALIDYFVRGGFPEIAQVDDLREARRRLRQDILDRALGRDITDVANVDTRLLERLFLRVCLHPGGLWNEVEVANALQVSRATISRYLQILEQAFLVFRLPNLASPIKGQPKIYLVAPSMRQALLALDENDARRPEDWGQIAENVVAAAAIGTNADALQIGFWRKQDECDVVIVNRDGPSNFIEVKRSGVKARRGIERAAAALGLGGVGCVLTRDEGGEPTISDDKKMLWIREPAAAWLYRQDAHAGGTLRIDV